MEAERQEEQATGTPLEVIEKELQGCDQWIFLATKKAGNKLQLSMVCRHERDAMACILHYLHQNPEAYKSIQETLTDKK